jgi:hypothetical protein
VLNDQKEGKKQTTFPTKKRKKCAHTNITREGPNGRCSKDLTPKFKKFKPRLLVERGPKRK